MGFKRESLGSEIAAGLVGAGMSSDERIAGSMPYIARGVQRLNERGHEIRESIDGVKTSIDVGFNKVSQSIDGLSQTTQSLVRATEQNGRLLANVGSGIQQLISSAENAEQMQLAILQKEAMQEQIEETLFQIEETVSRYAKSVEAEDDVVATYFSLLKYGSSLQDSGLSTPIIKGRDNKKCYTQSIENVIQMIQTLEEHPEVKDSLNWIEEQERQKQLDIEKKQEEQEKLKEEEQFQQQQEFEQKCLEARRIISSGVGLAYAVPVSIVLFLVFLIPSLIIAGGIGTVVYGSDGDSSPSQGLVAIILWLVPNVGLTWLFYKKTKRKKLIKKAAKQTGLAHYEVEKINL